MATERGAFVAPALWSALFAAIGQGAHVAFSADHLTAFATVLYTGLLAPLLILGAAGVALVCGSAVARGWLHTSASVNRDRFLDWSWRDDVDALARRSASICAAALAVGVFLLVSWALGRAILEDVERPAMGLALLVGLQVAVAAVAVGAYVVLVRPLTWVACRLRQRALVAPATLVALSFAIVFVGAIIVRTATAVGPHLPWDLLTASVCAVAGWTASRAVGRPKTAIVALIALVTSFLVAVFMPADLASDRAIFTEGSPVAAALYQRIHDALDRDKDGFIHLYGGGDCAPDDPEIHPNALEILNNGIDEDCSGADFTDDVSFEEAAQSFGRPKQVKGKPHIVLITTDSLSMDRTSLGRTDRDTTPNLAAWAKGGAVVYDAAFALGPSTRLALPGLLAGQFNSMIPMLHGRRQPYDWNPKTATLAKLLGTHGYRTVMVTSNRYFVSRWKNGPSVGFDTRDESATKKPIDQKHTAPAVTEAAIKHLETAAADGRPTFLWVHYYDHHHPFERPPNGVDYGPAPADVFDSELQYADRYWGTLFESIDRLFGGENVVVAFTADHGEAFDEFHPKKHHGYDLRTPVLHVPLIIAAPNTPHRRVAGLTTHADVAPTIADIVGLARHPDWIGESLTPTLWGPDEPQKSIVYGLFYLPERFKTNDPFSKISARTDDWYYERDLRNGAERLTNWPNDPTGANDLATKQRETTEVLRHVALQKLDDLKKSERALSATE